MMGGRRLVRLRLDEESKQLGRAAEALTDHLAGAFNPDAFFLIETGRLRRDAPLRKVAEKSSLCAVLECYADEIGDVEQLTRDVLAADGIHLTSEALDLFVSRLPHERGVARQEIERLALYLGPGSRRDRRPGRSGGLPGRRARSLARRRGPGRLRRPARPGPGRPATSGAGR